MSRTEPFPNVKLLPPVDEIRLMPFLVVELAQEEGVSLLTASAEYPIWTPLNAFGAAEIVMNMLKSHQVAA